MLYIVIIIHIERSITASGVTTGTQEREHDQYFMKIGSWEAF